MSAVGKERYVREVTKMPKKRRNKYTSLDFFKESLTLISDLTVSILAIYKSISLARMPDLDSVEIV